jgi:Coenzyme PQQ synthesis protein D (PqqD)
MPSDDLLQHQMFHQNPDVVSSRLGDAGVLVNLRTNRILELNVTGIRIWELIGDGLSVGEIGQRLHAEFDAPPDEVHSELRRLIGELTREGLIDDSDRA